MITKQVFFDDKLSETEKSTVEAAIADVKQALEGGETEAIVQAMEKLNTAQHKAAETLYKAGQEAETPAPDAEATADTSSNADASSDGAVIDAEVVEDEKK